MSRATSRRRSPPTAARSSPARRRPRPPTRATSSSAPPGSSAIGGGNFVETMLRLAADHGEVLVVRDQVGSPTYTWHLAHGIVRLIEGLEYGIHHMAAAGHLLLVRVRARDLRAGGGRVQSPLRRPPRCSAARRPARRTRPSTSQREHAIELPSWQDGLAGYLAQRRARGRRHEDPGHRRRRLHRLHLRPAGPRASTRCVVLDKLTYAGRRENLPDGVELVVGAIEDPAVVREAMEGCDAVVNFAAESHVDRSIDDQDAFARTHVIGTGVLLDAARELGRRALPAGLHRRGLRLDRVGLLHRDLAARSLLALLGDQGRRRPARLRASPHLRDRGLDRAAARTTTARASTRRS